MASLAAFRSAQAFCTRSPTTYRPTACSTASPSTVPLVLPANSPMPD